MEEHVVVVPSCEPGEPGRTPLNHVGACQCCARSVRKTSETCRILQQSAWTFALPVARRIHRCRKRSSCSQTCDSSEAATEKCAHHPSLCEGFPLRRRDGGDGIRNTP